MPESTKTFTLLFSDFISRIILYPLEYLYLQFCFPSQGLCIFHIRDTKGPLYNCFSEHIHRNKKKEYFIYKIKKNWIVKLYFVLEKYSCSRYIQKQVFDDVSWCVNIIYGYNNLNVILHIILMNLSFIWFYAIHIGITTWTSDHLASI